MPIDKYFQGHGSEVMASMQAKHGAEAGEREFYATANDRGMKPGVKPKPAAPKPKYRPGRTS
jgi:hypothetical protein